MTTIERNKLAIIIRKFFQERRVVDKATASTKKAASEQGKASTQRNVRRYCHALEYVELVDNAWDNLSDKEKTVLKDFYGREKRRSGACLRMQNELDLSERQVYRLAVRGLANFRDNLIRHGVFQEVITYEH